MWMADQRPHAAAARSTEPADSSIGFDADDASPPGVPRWVKLLGITVIVLVLAFVVLHLSGHMPIGHMTGASGTQLSAQFT